MIENIAATEKPLFVMKRGKLSVRPEAFGLAVDALDDGDGESALAGTTAFDERIPRSHCTAHN